MSTYTDEAPAGERISPERVTPHDRYTRRMASQHSTIWRSARLNNKNMRITPNGGVPGRFRDNDTGFAYEKRKKRWDNKQYGVYNVTMGSSPTFDSTYREEGRAKTLEDCTRCTSWTSQFVLVQVGCNSPSSTVGLERLTQDALLSSTLRTAAFHMA